MKKLFLMIIFVLSALSFSANAANNNLYFDIANGDSGITYVSNGNTVERTGNSIYFNRSANTKEAYIKMQMPDGFGKEREFVLEFTVNTTAIKGGISFFKASGPDGDFAFMQTNGYSQLVIPLSTGAKGINLAGITVDVKLCVNLDTKLGKVIVGTSEYEVDYSKQISGFPALADDYEINSFTLGTANGGPNAELTVSDIRVHSGSYPVSYILANNNQDDTDRIYFDIANGDAGITYLPKGNVIERTGNSIYINRTANENDAFIDIAMPDKFSDVRKFVVDFTIDVDQLKHSLRFFRADGVNGYFDFLHTNAYGQLVIPLTTGAIGIPMVGKTLDISLCVDLDTKLGKIYVGDTIYEVDYDNLPSGFNNTLPDDFTIQSFRLGTNSTSGVAEFTVSDILIYSGSTPLDDTSSVVTLRKTVMDSKDGSMLTMGIIGTNKVFSEDVFYSDEHKLNSKTVFGSYSYYIGKTLMVPLGVCRVLGIESGANGDRITLNGAEINVGSLSYTDSAGNVKSLNAAPETKDGITFVPLTDICSLAGLYTYADKRGYVAVGESELNLSDSTNKYEHLEDSDKILRFIKFDRPSGKSVVDAITSKFKDASWILVTPERLSKVLGNIASNEESAKMYEKTIAEADALLDTECVEYYIPDGLRLIEACQTVKSRMKTLSAAYLLTSETKYAVRIWAELENCLNWSDWNTSRHYLDSGMIGPGVAIAYDTLKNYLTDDQKAWVRQRIYNLYLAPTIAAYEGSYSGSEFRYSTTNWGAACAGSILTVCLAIAPDIEDEYRYDIEYLIENAMHSLEFSSTLLFPDGAWDEGVGYGMFVGEGLVDGCIGMLTEISDDCYGFLNSHGIEQMFDFAVSVYAFTGVYNYSDNGYATELTTHPDAYRIALINKDSDSMSTQKKLRDINNCEPNVLDVLWYEPSLDDGTMHLSNDLYWESADIGIMRSSYVYKSTPFIGIKSGVNEIHSGHFDKGSFVFEREGERWALDLGREVASISGGYSGTSGFTLYKKRTEGHNCVVINPTSDTTGQLLHSVTTLEKSDFSDGSGYMIFDLTDAYADNASSYKRGFYFGDGRETLTVRDEISLLEDNSDLYWFMHTRANIEIDADKKGATLSLNGKELRVTADCSEDNWYFEVRDTTPFDPSMTRPDEASRAGINKLTMVIDGSGDVDITVKLSPKGINTFSTEPLEFWECESEYIKPPFFDITRKNGKITLNVDSSSDFDKAIVAEYNGNKMITAGIYEISDTSEIELGTSAHTKIFLWDNLTPDYRYYEFNSAK